MNALSTLALLVVAAPAAGAFAAAPVDGHALAAGCAACHGTDGHAVGGMPSLASMPRDVLRARLEAFRHGTRPGTVMPQLARGYSDREIAAIAAWLAARPARTVQR